jgi:hypothetical protein
MVNSKQVVAAVSAIVLVVILVYPALSTGTVSIILKSSNIENADHVYVSVGDVWVHRLGHSSSDGWELVSNQSQTVDLISLKNSAVTFGKGQVPVGGYDGIKMAISNVTWVFNKTTTRLSVQIPQLQTNLVFTAQAGRGSTIAVILTGQSEIVNESKFFVPNITATLSGMSTP